MFKDENFTIYTYALTLCGVGLVGSFLAADPTIEVAGIERDPIALGEIETASIPQGSPEAVQARWNAPQIPWTNFEQGMSEVARSGKPALMVLHADWCRVCASYQQLFSEPEITRFSDDYVFVLVDVDDRPDLQRRYDIDGDYIPRTVMLEGPGQLSVQSTGDHPRQRFFVDPYDPGELSGLLETGAPATGR